MTIDVVELVMTNMTETDSDITRDDRDEIEGVGTNTNNDDITRGYN